MKPAKIRQIFEIFKNANPKPKGELYYTNNYTLLVAVLLSAQATDKGVNKATQHLFKVASTPQDALNMGEGKLREAVKSIGLYKTKAANIIKMSTKLISEHGGEVPNNQQALESLAGVGRKTANVVRNIAFGEVTMAVDTHIFRISNRTGIAKGKNVLEVEKGLIKNVPAEFKLHAHHWLILHGRYVCTARKPKCAECLISKLCEWKEKTN